MLATLVAQQVGVIMYLPQAAVGEMKVSKAIMLAVLVVLLTAVLAVLQVRTMLMALLV
jgi:hypothetical protein